MSVNTYCMFDPKLSVSLFLTCTFRHLVCRYDLIQLIERFDRSVVFNECHPGSFMHISLSVKSQLRSLFHLQGLEVKFDRLVPTGLHFTMNNCLVKVLHTAMRKCDLHVIYTNINVYI